MSCSPLSLTFKESLKIYINMYPWFFFISVAHFQILGKGLQMSAASMQNSLSFPIFHPKDSGLWHTTARTHLTKHQTPHNTTPQHAHTTSPNTTAHRTTPRPTSNHLVQHVTMTDDKTNRKLCHKYSIFKQIVRLIKFLQTMNKR